MKSVEDILIAKMQQCNNIFGDKILSESQAKDCLLISIDLIIDALESRDDPNWWKDFKEQVKTRNTAYTF